MSQYTSSYAQVKQKFDKIIIALHTCDTLFSIPKILRPLGKVGDKKRAGILGFLLYPSEGSRWQDTRLIHKVNGLPLSHEQLEFEIKQTLAT